MQPDYLLIAFELASIRFFVFVVSMSEDLQRNRSPNSPRINAKDAIETVGILYQKAGRSALTRLAAVKALGYSGFTGSSLTILGALSAYGLLDRSKGDVRVSDLALQILHPVNTKSKTEAIRTATLSPKIFAEIYEKWHDLAEDVLCNQLIHSGYTPQSAKRTAAVYKSNCELANLDGTDRVGTENKESSQPNSSETPLEATQPSKRSSPMSVEITFGGELPIPIGDGKIARIPFPMAEDDYNLLLETLGVWKKRLVKTNTVFGDEPRKMATNLTGS